MCNNLHVNYVKIDSEGKAYKLIHLYTEPSADLKWRRLVGSSQGYVVDTDGWIRWRDHYQRGEIPDTLGFCFAPTLKGAFRTRDLWNVATGRNAKIVEVSYRQGLGRFIERHFIFGLKIDVMLAREFEITREIKP